MEQSELTRRQVIQTLSGVVGGLAFAGLPQWARAQAQEKPSASVLTMFDKIPIHLTPLSANLHLLDGPGGNIVVATADEGTLIVDAGVPARGPDILKAASGLNHRPVKTVINTHWHTDHAGGNETMGKAGARIIAHENTRKRLGAEQTVEIFNVKVPPSPRIAFPTVTFADTLTLYHGDQELHLIHVAPAHTDSDLFVHFVNANILQTGDLLFNGFYPVIDYSSGGWIGGMIEASERMLGLADAQTKIVPGHGPLATKADLTAARDMLATVYERIGPQVKAGKTIEEVVAAKPTQDLDEKWGKGFFNGEQFTRIVYMGIVRHGV